MTIKTLIERGDGIRTVFSLPIHNQTATATVNGSGATLSSQTRDSVTFSVAPASDSTVAITFDDIGTIGSGTVQILGQQHVTVTAPANTAENTLYSLVIPGGLMGPNDSLRVTFAGSQTNNTNSKTWYVRLGGVQLGSRAATSTSGLRAHLVVSNRNSLSNQIVGIGSTLQSPFTDSAPVTASVNTAVNQTLTISASKATGTDSLTLESVLVELIRGV